MDGWVKLYRRFLNWQWFSRPEMVQIFIYILLSASHKDHVWQCVNIRRGEFPTSVDALVRATGLTTQQVRTCLTRLERTGEIVRKSTNKYTIISVCNFDDYQIDEDADQQSNNNQTTNNQQSNNNQITTLGEWKERNNGKNGGKTTITTTTINSQNNAGEGFSFARLTSEEQAAEKRDFYRAFFFANAVAPSKQVAAFIRHNERFAWTTKSGVTFWTREQRLALAEGYCADPEFKTCMSNEIGIIKAIYDELTKAGRTAEAESLLRDGVGAQVAPGRDHVVTLYIPRDVAAYLSNDAPDILPKIINDAWTVEIENKKMTKK